MEKKRKVISFRITSKQEAELAKILAKQGDNKNTFFRKLVQKLIEEEASSKQ